ncbi:hypothetical protein BGW80DRAFT_1254609 [Lactifluus volemus]|nr:hypothetical protein BGW80DRAFT_1255729 [Lactifluus volemus]KAH9967651.1 hypothetical protein BGW80DRAFT_1254609 [Lactifluus volemus]
MSNAGTPNTPQTPSRKVYNPIFKELKRSLCNATFIGSFVGEGLPLKPVPYPEEPSGERVAVHDLSAYHQRRCWDMPMCFCGLLTGKDHPARFHVPKSLQSPNYGRPSIMCSTSSCSYWVDLEKFILANPNTPRCIYPLRDGLRLTAKQLLGSPDPDGEDPYPCETPRKNATHLETKEEETTPTITSSQLPQVEAEVLRPSQAGSSSYSAIGRSDMELLDYGTQARNFPIPDVFTTTNSLQQNLEAALRPVDVDSARALLLTIFDPTCPGISITEFLRVVSQCPVCHLLTSSSLIHAHHCPSPSGSGEPQDTKRGGAQYNTRKRRIIAVPSSSAIGMAQRNDTGGSQNKRRALTRDPTVFMSSETKPVCETSPEPVVVIEISSDED